MVKTLASHLITAQNAWSSLYKAALIAGAFWLFASHPGWVWLTVFFAVGLAIYFSSDVRRRMSDIRFAYWGVLVAAAVIVLGGESSFAALAALGAALALVTWAKISYPVAAVLIAAAFSGVGLFTGVALISWEAYRGVRLPIGSRTPLIPIACAGMAGLIALQVGWFARALPFFGAAGAVLVAMTLAVMRDFLSRSEKSSQIAVLRAVTVFLLALVALFMSAAW